MIEYQTDTGFYILRDSDERIIGKANLNSGTYLVPDAVDLDKSFDVDSAKKLQEYNINSYYLVQSEA